MKWFPEKECYFQGLWLSTFEVGCRAQIIALQILRWSLHGILFRRLMSELSGKLATFSDLTCTILPLSLYREAWQKDLQFVWKFVKTSKPSASAAATLCKKRCLLSAVRTVFYMVNRQSSSVLDPRP